MAHDDPWKPDSEGRIDVGKVVTGAFREDEEAAGKYVEALRLSARDVAASISRTVLLLLALVGTFLLLTFAQGAPNSRITLGPIGLTDVSAIERVLPAIVAYLFYQLAALTAVYDRADWVIEAIMAHYRPSLAQSHLDRLLMPQLPQLYSIGHPAPEGRLAAVGDAASLGMTIGLVVLPALFEVYAFYRLFDRYGFGDVIVSVALLLSAVAIVSAIATYVERFFRQDYMFTKPFGTPRDTGRSV